MTTDDGDLVVVLETGSRSLLELASALLEAAGIQHLVQGSDGAPILGAALFPLPLSPKRAPCRIRVAPAEARRATEVLDALPPAEPA